ncbi:MAG: YitT family protein [Bacillota bacterium]|nr:YitT family protein [Bacillota bacterium]
MRAPDDIVPTPSTPRTPGREGADLRSGLMLVAGAAIFSLGLNGLVVANGLAEGGLSGISVIIHYFTGWPVGVLYLLLNVPLLVLGYVSLGGRFTLRTLVGAGLVTGALILTRSVRFPMDDLLLASLYGGVINGTGLGLMFRAGGSSGGLDILAQHLRHHRGLTVAETYLVADGIVLAAAGLLLGADTALYALIVTFVGGRVADLIQEGPNRAKAVLIITDRVESLTHYVTSVLERGATVFDVRGAYTGQPRGLVMTVLSRRELARLKQQVRQLDPGAFMVVQDATEVIGEGFGAIVPPHGPGPTPLRVGRRLPRFRRRTQPPHQRPEIVRDGGPQA